MATVSMMFSKGSQSSGDPRLKLEYDTRARAIFKIGPHLQGHKQMYSPTGKSIQVGYCQLLGYNYVFSKTAIEKV